MLKPDSTLSKHACGRLQAPRTDVLRPVRWIVDPEFAGAFPLAGVICEVVDEEPAGDANTLKVRFQDLPPAVERDIVRQVYQHQLLEAGGRDAALRQQPVPGEILHAPGESAPDDGAGLALDEGLPLDADPPPEEPPPPG